MKKVLAVAVVSVVACVSVGIASAAEGDLTYVGAAPDEPLIQPGPIAISPDGERAYVAANGFTPTELVTFDRDPGSGALTRIETERNNVDDPSDGGATVTGMTSVRDVDVSPDGEYVYALSPNQITIFETDGDGRLVFVTGNDYSAEFSSPEELTITPDGEGIIVVDRSADSVYSFDRSVAGGGTTLVDTETDGVNDGSDAGGVVDGIDGLTGVSISGGNQFVFTSADLDDAVASFTRDTAGPDEGELSFADFERDGVGGVDGLNGASDVVFASGNIYVAGYFDSAVAVFTRDIAGLLTYDGREKNGVDDLDPEDPGGAVDGMSLPEQLATDGARESIYVTGVSSDSVVVFDRDVADDDTLIFSGFEADGVDDPGDGAPTVDGLTGVEGIALAPDDSQLYATGKDDGAIARFDRTSDTELEFAGRDPEFSVGPVEGVGASPDGNNVYTANGEADSVGVFSRAGDGSLTPVETESDGADDPDDPGGAVAGIDGTFDVLVSPDGEHVFATGYVGQGLASFSRDAGTGALSFVGSAIDEEIDPVSGLEISGLIEATGMAFSPDGKFIYVTSNSDYSISTFELDGATGAPIYRQTLFDDEGDVPKDGLYGAWDVEVSADGKYVYVAALDGDAVSVFSRNAASGLLTYVETEFDQVDDPTDAGGAVTGMSDPEDLVLSRNGEQAYVVTSGDGSVLRFERNAGNGKLSFVEAQELPAEPPSGIVASEDGRSLIISSDGDDAVQTVDRSLADGSLTLGPVIEDQPGLRGALDLAISDDSSIYVAGEDDNQIGILDREPDTTGPQTKFDKKPTKKKKQGKKKKNAKFKFSSSSEDFESFECRRDTGKKWKSCTSAYKKKYKAGDKSYKKHTFSVRAIDGSGNKDDSPAKFTFKRKLK